MQNLMKMQENNVSNLRFFSNLRIGYVNAVEAINKYIPSKK